jgi:hypothetical protein
MKKIIRLTESDLQRIVKRVISEQGERQIKVFANSEGYIVIADYEDKKFYVYQLEVDKGFWVSLDVLKVNLKEKTITYDKPLTMDSEGTTTKLKDNDIAKITREYRNENDITGLKANAGKDTPSTEDDVYYDIRLKYIRTASF